jgi:hypothetical protein
MLIDNVRKAPAHYGGIWRLVAGAGRWLTSFPGLLGALLATRIYWTCRDRIADPDLWWHLKNAQHLAATGHFPNFDTYSFTAAGSPWLAYEWISESAYYGAYHALGLRGIFILFTVILAVMVMAVFRLAARASGEPFSAAVVTLVGGLLASVGFSPRTQLFGWLCFLGVYAILLRMRERRDAPLWLIPILFCVWINCHGSWPIGLLIYGMVVGCGLIRRDIGRLAAVPWSAPELRRLAFTGLASLAALWINPFGYRLLLYPFEVAFRQHVMVANVEEWASVDFNGPGGTLVALVLAGFAYLVMAGRRRWRIDEAVLATFVLFAGIIHMRLFLLAGLVLPPLLAPQIGRLSSYDPRRERRVLNASFLLAAAALVYITFPSDRMLRDEISAYFPVDSIEFLKSHPQQGRLFNGYEMGGFLEWNLPGVPVFIDTRTDLFEYKGVLQDYLAITGVHQSQELLDHYGVTYVLYPKDTPLAYLLENNGHWERIYEGARSIIFRRVGQT